MWGVGAEVAVMAVIHALLARLGRFWELGWSSVGIRWDGDALDCASTDRLAW